MSEIPYEDADYIQIQKLPTANSEEFSFLIRHKVTGNLFSVRAKDRTQLAAKIMVGDWESDPKNIKDPDDDEQEGEGEDEG